MATESTISVLNGAGATKVVQAAPSPVIVSSTVATPSTSNTYAIGDVMAQSATAGSCTAFSWVVGKLAGGLFALEQVQIDLATTNTNFLGQPVIMKFYDTAPTFTVGDDGVWALNTAPGSGYRGDVSVTLNNNFGAGTQITLAGVGQPAQADKLWFTTDGSATIYGILTAGTAVSRTAVAHSFTARIAGMQF